MYSDRVSSNQFPKAISANAAQLSEMETTENIDIDPSP